MLSKVKEVWLKRNKELKQPENEKVELSKQQIINEYKDSAEFKKELSKAVDRYKADDEFYYDVGKLINKDNPNGGKNELEKKEKEALVTVDLDTKIKDRGFVETTLK